MTAPEVCSRLLKAVLVSLIFAVWTLGASAQPLAETFQPVSVSPTSATLYGVINPNGGTVVVTFDYGQSGLGYSQLINGTYSGETPIAFPLRYSGLQPNTTYRFRIRAEGTNGSAEGTIISFTTPTQSASTASIEYVSPAPVPASSNNITIDIFGSGFTTGTTLTFRDTQDVAYPSVASKLTVVPPSRITYGFNSANDGGLWTVRANPVGGTPSTPASFRVGNAPTAPSTLTATPTESPKAITLSWSTPQSNVDEIRILKKEGSGAYTQLAVIVDRTTTTYTDSLVNKGTRYTYRLYAHNHVGNSPYSPEAQAIIPTTINPPTLSSPGGTTESPTVIAGTMPLLDWQSNGLNYIVRVSKLPYGEQNIVLERRVSISEYEVQHGELELGVKYRWDVASVDSNGNESLPSANLYFTTGYSSVLSPTLLSPGTTEFPGASVPFAHVELAWQSNGGTRYTLIFERYPFGPGNQIETNALRVSSTTRTIFKEQLAPSTTYRWTVVAYGNSWSHSPPAPYKYFTTSAGETGAPTPVISSTASPIYQNQPVTFSSSTVPTSDEATVVSWKWKFSNDPSEYTSRNITRTFTSGNRVTARLTITDQSGRVSSVEREFEIKGVGDPQTQASATSLDPVNLATGNFVMDAQDLILPGRGLPFVFHRFYNSKAFDPSNTVDTPGPLGWGWTHNFEVRLFPPAVDSEGRTFRRVRFGDGHEERFFLADGSFTAEPGVRNILHANTDGTFALTGKNQIEHLFGTDAENGRLTGIRDRNGNTLTCIYTDGRLASVTDTVGRTITFGYATSGHLASMSDGTRTIEYTVDESHDLTSVKDARGHATTFTYDPLHQLLTGTDPRAHTFVRNTYNSIDRTVTEQLDANGARTAFEYHFGASPAFTVVTREGDGGENEVTKHYHDSKLRLIKQTDGRGDSFYEAHTYDDATGDRTSYRDKNGNTYVYEYDARGNVTKITNPGDNGYTTFEYNALNDPVLRSNDRGIRAKWEYDAKGNQTAYAFPYDPSNPSKYRRTQVPNAYGQVESSTDANQGDQAGTTQFFYDAHGNNWKTIDAEGNETVREFDSIGRQRSDTDGRGNKTVYTLDANGNVELTTLPGDPATSIRQEFDANNNRTLVVDQLGRETKFEYDEQNRLIKSIDPLLYETVATYDKLGRKTSVTSPGQGTATVTTTFGYDLAGNQISVTDGLGKTSLRTFDGNGNVLTETDADGVAVTYEYDALNRRTKVTNGKGESAVTAYNTLGQVTSATHKQNGQDRISRFEYNDAGQRVKLIDAAGTEFSWAFDYEGNMTSATHGGNKTRTMTYFKNHRLKTSTDELGNVESYTYDAALNLESFTNAENQTVTYTYDSLNRLVTVGYPSGPPTSFSYLANGLRETMEDTLGTTTWTYTVRNEVETVTNPYSKVLSYTYHPSGARKTVTYPGAKTASYSYDAVGRLKSVLDWNGQNITRDYTDAGRVQAIHYPNGIETVIEYDEVGREKTLSHALSTATPFISYTFAYDEAGNVTSDGAVHPLPFSIPEESESLTHDSANQILTMAGAPFTHDKRGNILSGKLSANASDTLTWDVNGRLISASVGGNSQTNAYNGLGERLETTVNGASKRFVVDSTGAMAQVMAETDASGTVSTYYLYFGGLAARILPDGTTSYYHADRVGSVVALTGSAGSITDLYHYDPFGVPAGTSGTSTNPFRYLGAYGVYDDQTGLLFARARYYHPSLGRFVSRDPLLGNANDGQSLNRYVYGLNNPFGFIDPSGLEAIKANVYTDASLWDRLRFATYVTWLDFRRLSLLGVHLGLDVVGLADPTGAADAANSLIYLLQGDVGNAALSGVAATPVGFAATLGKWGKAGAAAAENAGARLALNAPKPTAFLTQNGLEHIVGRHWATSGAKGAGRFADGTTAQSLRGMIDDAVGNGAARPNTAGRPGQIFEYDFGRQIGTDIGGNAATRLRVVVRPNGEVVTAFPY